MTRHRRLPSTARLAAIGLGLLLVLCLLPATRARAAFEQVATFDQSPRLLHSGGTAVNVTGAGGVPPGTVYAVASNGQNGLFPPSVVRYTPQGEFRAAWGYGVGNGVNEYQRCGPDGDPLYPTCFKGEESGGEGFGQLRDPIGVAVDQTTGNVYVLNGNRQHDVVQVFSADGSERLGGFGERAERGAFPVPAESIEETPEKLHSLTANGSGIAVDGVGRVYIPDSDWAEAIPPHLARVMVFEPESPGDYENYVYTGRENDIAQEYLNSGTIAAVDSAGDIYAAGDSRIREFAAGDHHLLCELKIPAGGLIAMTVNPTSGDVFYYTYKTDDIRRLRCNGKGEFVELESFAPSPKVDEVIALSFNPSLVYSGTRPPGALYGVAPNVKNPETGQFSDGLGYIFAQTEVHAPEVDSTTALEITSSSAVLRARVNPKGAETRYVFQYIDDAAYEANEPSERFAGASEAPLGGKALPPGLEPVTVAAVVQGLAPDGGYHYRVVAESCVEGEEPALCTTAGETRAFRTFPAEAPGAADNRAFELVSPVLKSSGEVYPARPFVYTPSCLECKPGSFAPRFPKLSSPDGERVVYDGGPFSFTEGSKETNEYFAQRTPTGWQTRTLNPVLMSGGGEAGYRGFSSDLGRAVFLQREPTLVPSAPSDTPNVYTQATGSPEELAPLLAGAAPNEGKGLSIEYGGASTDLGHVFFAADDALTGETPVAPAPGYEFNKKNLYEAFGGQLRLVNVLPGNAASALDASFGAKGSSLSNAISDDGSRVFWSDSSGQVYVREDGETTREIPAPGKFLTASADGSKVLLDGGELYDLETEALTDLSEGKGGFEGIAGQSEDLSRIYFVDTAVLDETPNGNGDSAEAGKNNLYAWHEGATAFIATLNGTGQASGASDWAASSAERTAKASPDGRWLAFQSAAQLTGFDNVGVCIYIPPGEKAEFVSGICGEVFLYDAVSGELRCPSCASTGEAPRGHSHVAILDKLSSSAPQVGSVTDQGRLYFDTANRLSPEDSNGAIEDVYEFEPEGIGACGRPGGCVVLVSSGHGSSDANLLAVDETGKNVFFTSRDQLALKDKDDLIDLYVAREGGGIAAESESLRSECQGEACQPAAIAPNDPTPSSASFHGKGNVKPAGRSRRCPKGKRRVTRRGKARCVRRKPRRGKARRRNHRRANHNRGGAK
jgi:hypothetical protein